MDKFVERLNKVSSQKILIQEFQEEKSDPAQSFQKLVDSGVKCDGLVISGHHTGSFGGKRGNGGHLDLSFLESLSCLPKNAQWFSKVRALWLQGCRTLGVGQGEHLETEANADFHTDRVGAVRVEDNLQQSLAQLNMEFSATLDDHNPLSSRFLRIFPRATVFGWTKTAPGEKANSQLSIPFHMAHVIQLTDGDLPKENLINMGAASEGLYDFSKIPDSEAKKYSHALTDTIAKNKKSKVTEKVDADAWRLQGTSDEKNFGFSNGDLNAHEALSSTDNPMLTKAKQIDCVLKNRKNVTELSQAIDEILSSNELIGYNFNSLQEALYALQKDDPDNILPAILAKLRGSERLQSYLLERLQGSRLGLLGKMDTYAFYRDFIGGKHDVLEKKIIEAAMSEKFLNSPDTSYDMRDYKETLFQSLIKNNLIKVDLPFIRSLKNYKNFPTHVVLKFLPESDDKEYFDLVLSSLRQCTGWSCREVLSALAKFKRWGAEAAPQLTQMINNNESSESDRAEAAKTVRALEVSTPELISALINLSKVSDHWASYEALNALGAIGTPRPDVLSTFDKAMESPNFNPNETYLGLARIGSRYPEPVLKLVRTWYNSPNEYKRKYSTYVLGFMAEAAIPEVPTLKKQLFSQEESQKHDDTYETSGGFSKSNDELFRKMNGEKLEEKIQGVEFALGMIGQKRPDIVLPITNEALASEKPKVRGSALGILALIKPKDIPTIHRMMASLSDKSENVSQRAALSIRYLDPDLSLPLIFKELDSADEKVKSRALESLPEDDQRPFEVSPENEHLFRKLTPEQKQKIIQKLNSMKIGASMSLQSDIHYAEMRLHVQQ